MYLSSVSTAYARLRPQGLLSVLDRDGYFFVVQEEKILPRHVHPGNPHRPAGPSESGPAHWQRGRSCPATFTQARAL